MKNPAQLDLPQRTLDLLILRVIALGPIHGYAIAQRIQVKTDVRLPESSSRIYDRSESIEES